MLSDFEPKGALARSLGVYLDGPGITDRATVVIDAGGVVRSSESVGPGGRRDIGELAAACERVDADWNGDLPERPVPGSFESGTTLYVKNKCGPSRAVAAARANLHLENVIALANVHDDASSLAALQSVAGKDQSPCLVSGSAALHEAADIQLRLASIAAPI